MTKEDKDILLRLLQQHKELGISEQIDYQKRYLRQLTEFGYLEAHGGNKNRTYSIISLLRKTAITWRNKKIE